MSRMFLAPNGKRMRTWSPLKGCLHNCYNGGCWAKIQAEKMQKAGIAKYLDGFKPAVIPVEFTPKFKEDDFVFVNSMGDMFGEWQSVENINRVLDYIRPFTKTTFLLQTKNPDRFHDINIRMPYGCYYGTTIETNRYYPVYASITPAASKRYSALLNLPHDGCKRFVSIEPIMDFDLDIMLKWMGKLEPDIVEVGSDNYKCCLAEPSWDKVEALLKGLREICPTVIEKQGLERLKK